VRVPAAELLVLYPDFANKVHGELRMWNLPGEMIKYELDGLRKAGLDIPPEQPLRSAGHCRQFNDRHWETYRWRLAANVGLPNVGLDNAGLIA
jgi:hypothetical protein